MLWNQLRARWRISDYCGTSKKCAVIHVQRRVRTHAHDTLRLRIDESMCVSDLEEGNQDCGFLRVCETRENQLSIIVRVLIRVFNNHYSWNREKAILSLFTEIKNNIRFSVRNNLTKLKVA